MLSKEEIKKAKESLAVQAITSKVGCEDYPNCICMKKDLIIALNYIDQLEKENNKQNKIIDEMAKWIFDKDYTENSLLIHRDDYYSNCKEQVKQYFKKKVEGK